MANFKIVKHRLRYHVIGYTGTLKPRTKGTKPTYKEQCISSHYTITRATKALDKYKATKLNLSNKPEYSRFSRWVKEIHIGIIIAVACGFAFEAYMKFFIGH